MLCRGPGSHSTPFRLQQVRLRVSNRSPRSTCNLGAQEQVTPEQLLRENTTINIVCVYNFRARVNRALSPSPLTLIIVLTARGCAGPIRPASLTKSRKVVGIYGQDSISAVRCTSDLDKTIRQDNKTRAKRREERTEEKPRGEERSGVTPQHERRCL